ncbi:MAG: hypothetical protein RR902_05285, partial [Oscillospiraceae bacterium]
LGTFTACGKDDKITDEATKDEMELAVPSTSIFPIIVPEAITEDPYQFFQVSDTQLVYKITEVLTQRANIVVPVNGNIKVQLKLTNSSTRAKNYVVSLWQTDGEDMQFLKSIYSPVGEELYECNFTDLDPALCYRIIVSTDRGYASGMFSVENATIYSASDAADVEEEEA